MVTVGIASLALPALTLSETTTTSTVGWMAPPLWQHPMRDGANNAPGTYTTYDWPTSEASESMEVHHVWTTIPTASQTDGNGVFASSQFWMEATDQGLNSAGYMGSQVSRSGSSERRQFIFSCWDADSSHQVSWTGSNCERFGGEGVGSHCQLVLPVQEGTVYKFRLALSSSDDVGAHWTGKVTDMSTNEEHVVGTLVYPHVAGYVGFGKIKAHSDDFLEYFAGGDCDGAVTSGVGIYGPYFHDGAVVPSQAYPSYGSSDCKRSVVDGCIPGHGCGSPRAFMAGGKGVTRDTADGQPLWTVGPTPTPAPTPGPSPSPTPSGGVSCGAHHEPTCAECPQGHGVGWCNGECQWDGDPAVADGVCVHKGSDVSCGAHRMPTCAQCPLNHGSGWCNGDCSWRSGTCTPTSVVV